MTDTTLIRLGILAAGVLLILAIFWFGRPPKKTQGTRIPAPGPVTNESNAAASLAEERSGADTVSADGDHGNAAPAIANADAEIGKRVTERLDKVVKLFVAARTGTQFDGSDIVVAAEKIGLVYGFGGAYHRLVERKPQLGPIFTVANVQQQGSLDVATIANLQTPAIAFYLVLPAPIGALDALDMMLPAAQRAAELLGGILLDDQQNAMTRQSQQHLREELRRYDREHELDLQAGRDPRRN